MNLLILKGFNNYFNRKIKKYSDLEDYKARSSYHYTFENINFNPNDGILTSQVVGSENQKETDGSNPQPLRWETEGTPDYIVAYTTETVDENTVVHIHSRWFVLESVRTRNGQYQLALKRDVIADHLEQVLTNPCFVEKGYVKPNNPLIFNDEGVNLNEIKQGETMLKDETGVPWLVMYIAKNYPTGGADKPVEGKTIIDTSQTLAYTDLPWSSIVPSSELTSGKTRRVPGAGEINISPVVGVRCNADGWGKFIWAPYRINLRYNYFNDWYLDKNTTNSQFIGRRYQSDVDSLKYLTRKDINILTNPNTDINWGVNRNVEAFYRYWTASGIVIIHGTDQKKFKNWSETTGEMIKQYADFSKNLNSASNISYIKTYLNGKKSWLEANTGHSVVPGNPNMEAYVGGPQSFLPSTSLLAYNNKVVTADNVNYYRIKITRANTYSRPIDYFLLAGDGTTILGSSTNGLKGHLINNGQTIIPMEANEDNTTVETFFEHAWFDITYERIQGELLRFTVPKPSTRVQLNDAAFDMVAMPFGAIKFVIPNDGNTADLPEFTSTAEASLGMMRSIAAELSSSMYDLQLLPYCPYREVAEQFGEDGYINFGLTSQFAYGAWSGVYKIAQAGDTPSRVNARSIALWCYSSHGSFDIEHHIDVPSEDSFEYKLFSACKKFRLVSPNYSSLFEFNPLKNNGVSIFNVDFNYRPFNPYIHIAPRFEYLYGVDTNDNRGLILQGDFSVGYYSDKWADYQIQNANYNEIFNRQLKNIDVNQRIEREQTRTSYGVNIASEFLGLGGGLRGASAGSAGGPWGALIGGIAGTVGGGAGSIVGGVLDERWMKQQQEESRSYAIDMYNLNLGNVKALPYGLAKSDALTENFKYFPFIEEYDCTEVEKEIYRSKLLYDGMTVEAIGTINEYLPDVNYEFQKIKGRMIMIDNITDDFHIADDIYKEVNKGFYYINAEPEIEEGE